MSYTSGLRTSSDCSLSKGAKVVSNRPLQITSALAASALPLVTSAPNDVPLFWQGIAPL